MSNVIGRAVRLCIVLAGASMLGACATVISGTSQNVSVQTEPEGANCRLERAGAVIGIVNPTPGTVHIDRSKNDISVICKKEGYEDGLTPLPSSFTGTTFGNIILGGLVGVAVDAASGANNKYPENAYVILTPNRFASVQARDEHFAKIRDKISVDAAEAITKVKTECAADRKEQCNADIKKLEEERDRRLAEAEARRLAARVAS